jgi:hypothetical protein
MNIKNNIIFIALISTVFLTSSCDKQKIKDNTNKDSVLTLAPDTAIVEEEVWVVYENKMNDIPLTSESPTIVNKKDAAKKSTLVKSIDKKELKEEKPEVLKKTSTVKTAQMDSMLTQKQYSRMDSIQEELMVIPLEEKQTIIAYNKKGVEKESFQVISTEDGEVDQIIFTNKKHIDVYNVQAGMTGKEVKTLRKELKHMEKKGQVFLYDDTSNIMYLMDSKNKAGQEITESDIEPMEVQAIIWKDKKHHQKK